MPQPPLSRRLCITPRLYQTATNFQLHGYPPAFAKANATNNRKMLPTTSEISESYGSHFYIPDIIKDILR